MKRKLSIALIMLLVISLFSGMGNYDISAKAKKVKLSTKKVTVYKGKTKTIKLKNATKKVKWKVKNRKVAKIVKKLGKKKNTVKVKGLKKGSTKIIATHGKKKFTAKIVVKQKANTTVNVERETTSNVVETTKQEITTKVPETTNIVPETTTEVVEETTAIQNPHENKNIVASLENDKITVDDSLVINFTLQDYKEGQSMIWGIAPVKFEKYVDGEWASVNWIQGIPEPMYESVGDKGRLEIPLSRYFEITEGHYRWTHEVNWTEVTVEFDVYSSGTRVVGIVQNDKIAMDDDLVIQYYAVGEIVGDYSYTLEKGLLEIYENGVWMKLDIIPRESMYPEVMCSIFGYGDGLLTWALRNEYENIRPGHYRYTHEVAGETITVEFYVAYETEKFKMTAKPVKETIEVGEELKYELDVLESNISSITYGAAPVSFEKLVDGEWQTVAVKPDYGFVEEIYNISDVGAHIITVDIPNIYTDNSPGHYRYIHNFGGAYGVDVAVEFDIVEKINTEVENPHKNKNVVASLENDKITVDDSLVINFTLQDYKEGQSMIWGIAPVKFEKYVDGEWVRVNWIQGIPEPMYESVGDKGRLEIPLSRYFEMTEGHFRWTHEVNWTEVTVEFDIVAETEDENIVGFVLDNSISVEDMLVIEYSAMGFDTSDIITYNSLPETLEIFEDGGWIELKYKEDVTLSDVKSATLGNNKLPLVFTPSKYYQNVREGHYRYTHKIDNKNVSVEFDITQSEPALEESVRMVAGNEPALIISEITTGTLVLGENLVIKTIVTGKGDWEFTNLGSIPGKLEIYEEEAWNQMEVNNENVDFSDVGKMLMGSCIYEQTIELDSLYLNIRRGHYRYTYEIGGYDFVFKFDII